MSQTIQEMAVTEPTADRALATVFGLNSSECAVYEHLLESAEPMSARALADDLDCALTTAYRHIDALSEHDLVTESTVRVDAHRTAVYEAVDPETVAAQMQAAVDRTYEECSDAVEAFAAGSDSLDEFL
jgi:predicted transcriptional regulator